MSFKTMQCEHYELHCTPASRNLTTAERNRSNANENEFTLPLLNHLRTIVMNFFCWLPHLAFQEKEEGLCILHGWLRLRRHVTLD